MGSSRRAFFRQLVDRTLGQAADLLGEQAGSLVPARPRTRLRPPGAIDEGDFLERCYRCGNCVDVCPARAIEHIKGETDELNGTPVIVARTQACLVCDGLECMQACPSGALQPVAREAIRMGRATVDDARCLRSSAPDRPAEDCRVCVDLCPFDERALRIDDSGFVQVMAGCTGCGICEWKCPTEPPAIVVRP